jgi:ubiquinone/menaquinone biosynthesis methyltransferase
MDARWRRQVLGALDGAPRGASLDLCAGTMDLSRLLARAFPGERLVAVDFSPEMLARGRHKAPRAERIVADALALPFGDATFARVVCGFGVRNVSDLEQAVREAHRVLAPGGVFVTLELFRPSRLVTRAFQATYARAVLPGVGGAISGDRAAYRYLSRSMEGFMDRDAYAAVLRAAGFEGVRAVDLTAGIASIVSGRRAS